MSAINIVVVAYDENWGCDLSLFASCTELVELKLVVCNSRLNQRALLADIPNHKLRLRLLLPERLSLFGHQVV